MHHYIKCINWSSQRKRNYDCDGGWKCALFLSWIFTFPFEKKKLGLALIEKISPPLDRVFHHSSKHLRDTLLPFIWSTLFWVSGHVTVDTLQVHWCKRSICLIDKQMDVKKNDTKRKGSLMWYLFALIHFSSATTESFVNYNFTKLLNTIMALYSYIFFRFDIVSKTVLSFIYYFTEGITILGEVCQHYKRVFI